MSSTLQMNQLTDLLASIKEPNLTKTQLENLRDEMAHLYSLYQLEMAKIKKDKAFFWIAAKAMARNGKKGLEYPTNAEAMMRWEVTEAGQREIELKYESIALKEELSSIKHRLYNIY